MSRGNRFSIKEAIKINLLKKTLATTVAIALGLGIAVTPTTSAFASTKDKDLKSQKIQTTQTARDIGENQNSNKVITAKDEIKAEAKKENIPMEQDGKKLSKIEYEFVPAAVENNQVSTNQITPYSWDTLYYYINGVTDYGSGWYNSSDDLVYDLWWDGPDKAEVSETRSIGAEVSSTLGVSASGISAGVGFKVTDNYSVTFKSTTDVPAGKKLNVKVFRTFQKKSFDVYEYNQFSSDKYYGTGYAYKPNGAYFAKYWYN